MLGKKQLVIALMGLGLAGSCYAAGEAIKNSVTVNFKATVTAATCPFSVSMGQNQTVKVDAGLNNTASGEILVGEYTANETPVPKDLNFALDCAQSPFNSVKITSSATTGVVATKVGTDDGNAQFKFLNKDDDTVWKGDDSDAITTKTATKRVLFVMGVDQDKNIVTGTHEAPVTFTATYQ